MSSSKYQRPSIEVLKRVLTPEQYEVTQSCGTEPPFRNAFWNHKEVGIYVDVVTGEPLFSSLDKFDSGTGWPSFVKPLESDHVVARKEKDPDDHRIEVRSKAGDSHLGHVFPDGPVDRGGQRYCINSASLRFVPVNRLEAEGYGQYVKLFAVAGGGSSSATSTKRTEVATLAGGCFWGVQELLRKEPGVLKTRVGYTGGESKNPIYGLVKTGTTGHAEAVEVEFDPGKTSYEKILLFFFKMHDPTTRNQQGNDIGSQYRSAIFFHSPEQRKVAESVKERVERSGAWKKPLVTEIRAAGEFFSAEEEHQDYLQKHPGGYTCHWVRRIQF